MLAAVARRIGFRVQSLTIPLESPGTFAGFPRVSACSKDHAWLHPEDHTLAACLASACAMARSTIDL